MGEKIVGGSGAGSEDAGQVEAIGEAVGEEDEDHAHEAVEEAGGGVALLRPAHTRERLRPETVK